MVTAYLENRADERLVSNLDNQSYDESALISIKVPAVHLAYYNNSQQFERIDGKIEIRGLQYNFVKRRLYNDSIEMLCISNHESTQLKKDKNEFFKLVNDLQHSGQNKKAGSHASKSFSGEYFAVIEQYHLDNLAGSIGRKAFDYSEAILAHVSFTDERPPQSIG